MTQQRFEGHVVAKKITMHEAYYENPNTQTLSAALSLLVTDPRVQFIQNNSTANVNIALPAVAVSQGLFFHIFNRTTQAGGILTIRNVGNDTICVLGQNVGAFVVCDGSNWVGYVASPTT